jgi:proline iminopeptidase
VDLSPLSRRGFLAAASLLGLRVGYGLEGVSSAIEQATAAPKGRKPEVRTAGIRMVPVAGKYRVWTKRVEPCRRPLAGPPKILTLHGGPGATHEYLECFEDFLPQRGIEYYYYDQLGSAYSDQPDDPTLWTVERFREEVEQVRAGLGLEDFYLYGQSWGGLLAIEYALKYQKHLKGLIVSNMVGSWASYVDYVKELRRELPPAAIRVLEEYEAKQQYEAPEYQEVLMKELYRKRICRLDPWPEPVERAFRHLNPQVYNTMQGPSEFVPTGNLKSWNRWKDLHAIRVPTLLSVGRYDEMRVADVQKMGTLMPRARVSVCEQGSHFSMWDDQEAYFQALTGFVESVERQSAQS